MNRKFIIFIIILLLFATGGIFWWWSTGEKETMEESFDMGVLPEGFIVEERPEGIVIENKEMGFSFRVVEGWEFIGYMKNYIDLKSPDYEYNFESFTRVKGCLIVVGILSNRYPMAKDLIDQIQNDAEFSQDYEVIRIDGQNAFRKIERNEQLLKQGIKEDIEVGVSLSKTEIRFKSSIFQKEEKKCSEEFDKFLETISINK